MPYHILVVDDEESIRLTFTYFLAEEGYQVTAAKDAREAIALLEQTSFDVLFLDILLGRESGIDVLKASKEKNPNCPVLMITGSPEISTAADSVRWSAYDYLVKPLDCEALLQHTRRAIAYKNAVDEKERYQQRLNAVFQGVREGILVFDAHLRLIDMNFAGSQMLDLKQGDLGEMLDVLADQSSGETILNEIRGLVEARLEGELYHLEFKQPDGGRKILSVSIAPLRSAAGKEQDLVIVLRDETGSVRKVAA